MRNIPQYNQFKKIEFIDKGWSSDQKYYIETHSGKRLLLRITDASDYERKKKEYDMIKMTASLDFEMTRPIDFGYCDEGKKVFMLLTWVNGNDAQVILPHLPKEKQYKLGVDAGQILKSIHSLKYQHEGIRWEERYLRKIDQVLKLYSECGMKVENDQQVIDFIHRHKHLVKNRNSVLQHGDFHVGNLIITPDEKIGVVDFNRCDVGCPYEEFNRMIFSVHTSKAFSVGLIDGYFGGDVKLEFFQLMALYIALNTLGSLYWAIQFGDRDVKNMQVFIKETMTYYENFTRYIPTWYEEYKK